MDDNDKQRFAQAMEAAAVVYNREMTAILKRAYFEACRSMEIDEFEKAMAIHIATSKFFPTPADLRKPECLDGIAMEAYRIANDAMARHGSYRHVDFEDKAINAAIRSLGGWIAFGESSPSEEHFTRDRFLKAYKAYRQYGHGDEAGKPLSGIAQADACKRDATGRVIESNVVAVRIECATARKKTDGYVALIGESK